MIRGNRGWILRGSDIVLSAKETDCGVSFHVSPPFSRIVRIKVGRPNTTTKADGELAWRVMTEFDHATVPPDGVSLFDTFSGFTVQIPDSCFHTLETEHSVFKVLCALTKLSPLWILAFFSVATDNTRPPLRLVLERLIHAIPMVQGILMTSPADQEVFDSSVELVDRLPSVETRLIFPTGAASEALISTNWIRTTIIRMQRAQSNNIAFVTHGLLLVEKRPVGPPSHEVVVHGRIRTSHRSGVVVG